MVEKARCVFMIACCDNKAPGLVEKAQSVFLVVLCVVATNSQTKIRQGAGQGGGGQGVGASFEGGKPMWVVRALVQQWLGIMGNLF